MMTDKYQSYDAAAREAHARSNGNAPEFPVFTAHGLGSLTFPPIRFAVPGYITEGGNILAGRPKLGKSWLALEIALAKARGGYCLGDVKCEQGEVLYLALEDNKRRLQSRIKKVSPPHSDDTWPSALEFATEWPRCDEGGLEMLRQWAEARDNPHMIIVDVLAQFRSGRGDKESLYESDYRAVKSLQQLATDLNMCVLIIHHVRKGMGDVDPFERVSGTMGLTGAADTTLILDRDSNGCTLYARGRDIEEYEKAITFNRETCRWVVQGDVSEVRRTDERGAILAVLEDATEPMSPKEIEIATGMTRNNVDQLLFKMVKADEITKAKRGLYVHPDRADLIEHPPSTPRKNDKKVRTDANGRGVHS